MPPAASQGVCSHCFSKETWEVPEEFVLRANEFICARMSRCSAGLWCVHKRVPEGTQSYRVLGNMEQGRKEIYLRLQGMCRQSGAEIPHELGRQVWFVTEY